MFCTVPLPADVAALEAEVEAVLEAVVEAVAAVDAVVLELEFVALFVGVGAASTENAAEADIVTAQSDTAVERINIFLILCSFILLKFILLILIINCDSVLRLSLNYIVK